MSVTKTIADVLGLATASVAAYIAQDIVAEGCREEGCETSSEVLARLVVTTVVFSVVGSIANATLGKMFGVNN